MIYGLGRRNDAVSRVEATWGKKGKKEVTRIATSVYLFTFENRRLPPPVSAHYRLGPHNHFYRRVRQQMRD